MLKQKQLLPASHVDAGLEKINLPKIISKNNHQVRKLRKEMRLVEFHSCTRCGNSNSLCDGKKGTGVSCSRCTAMNLLCRYRSFYKVSVPPRKGFAYKSGEFLRSIADGNELRGHLEYMGKRRVATTTDWSKKFSKVMSIFNTVNMNIVGPVTLFPNQLNLSGQALPALDSEDLETEDDLVLTNQTKDVFKSEAKEVESLDSGSRINSLKQEKMPNLPLHQLNRFALPSKEVLESIMKMAQEVFQDTNKIDFMTPDLLLALAFMVQEMDYNGVEMEALGIKQIMEKAPSWLDFTYGEENTDCFSLAPRPVLESVQYFHEKGSILQGHHFDFE